MQQEPQALLTITIAGSDSRIQRRGAFADLIGERSLDHILSDFLDTSFFARLVLNGISIDERKQRAAEEIASLLNRGYQVMVRGNDGPGAESPRISPGNQKGRDLARRVDYQGAPCYLLNLQLLPAPSQTKAQQSVDEHVETLKTELRPKIESINFNGLFRGNLRAKAEALQAAQDAQDELLSQKEEPNSQE
jgi:hypothetical protein